MRDSGYYFYFKKCIHYLWIYSRMYLPVCLPSCTKKNDPNEWFPDDIFSDHIKYKALAGVKNKVFLTQNKEKSPGPH